jgi:hypothetical protein
VSKKSAEPTRPVFAVVGLRYGQEAQVSRRCRDLADLKFVRGDRSETAFPAVDAVLLLTRFIEHRWTEAAYRAFPRERVHLHAGGMSSLIVKIRTLAAGPDAGRRFLWRKKEGTYST